MWIAAIFAAACALLYFTVFDLLRRSPRTIRR